MSQKARSTGAASRKGAPAPAKAAPRAAAPAASKAPAQKRKRAPEPEPESEEDEEDDDLAELLEGAAAEGEDEEEDEGEEQDDEDEEELDVDPAEFLALQRRAKAAAADEEGDEMADEDGESSEDDGAEYGDDGTGTIARPAKRAKVEKKIFLNNKAALDDKRADIALPAAWPWIETLSISTNKSFADATEQAQDAAQDDLKREAAFYELSLSSASAALARLTDLGIPFRIPSDFFAERVKPDKHMDRIKDKLLQESAKLKATAERIRTKGEKRFAKQVQASKIAEKSADKKQALAAASKLRKPVEPGAGTEMPLEKSLLPGMAAHVAANRADDAARRERKSAKREAKDKKYGHGGKKRNTRKNDSDSTYTAGAKEYSLAKNRSNFAGFKDAKPGSFSDRRGGGRGGAGAGAGRGGFKNRNGLNFSAGSGRSAGSGGRGGFAGRGGRGGRGGGRGGSSRPGKSSRAQSRK